MKLKQYDFVAKRKTYFALSLTLIAIIFIVSLVFGVEMDVQFKGGSIITYTYSNTLDFEKFETFVEDTIGEKVNIDQKSGIAEGSDSIDIVFASDEGLSADKQGVLATAITKEYGEQLQFLSNASVDPVIGKEFFAKGLVAIIFASLVMVTYIAFRFKKINGWSAGVKAVIALIHDVILVFGTFAIFRIPLDDNFIAVVLTILGLSINDTIVIYDRIRENKRLYGKSLTVEGLVNKSINESMTRTLATSGAVFGTLIIVCIVSVLFNVSSIISFAFPMLVGTIFGTYSTIFIAGPLWVMWQNFKDKKATAKNSAHSHS